MIKEIQKKIYICDCCKKEFNELDLDAGLNECIIPMKYWYDGVLKTANKKIELCDECNEKLKSVIRDNFHKFSYTWCVGLEDDEDDK